MTKQTNELCALLPQFAPLFKAADARSSATWRIVRWENISPAEVCPNQVQILEGEYKNRTESLYANRYAAEEAGGYAQKGHNGLWKSVQGETTLYQCVMPMLKGGGTAANPSKSNDKEGLTSTMVRVEGESLRLLRGIAEEDGKTLEVVLKEAIREYDRQRFFAALDADYRRLRNDPQAWAEELAERKLWENTLLDGQDLNEIWHEDGTVTYRTEKEQKKEQKVA